MPELITDDEIGLIFAPVVIVTDADLPFDFDAALDEIAQMDADLEALRLGLRPMIYGSVPVKLYRRPRGWWKF